MKKILLLIALLGISAQLLCACAETPAAESSLPSKEESQYSEVETSSQDASSLSESESDEDSSQPSSKEESSKNETSSQTQSPSKNETSSKQESQPSSLVSSNKPQNQRPSVVRPSGSNQTSSMTSSDDVKVTVNPSATMGLGLYHFSPKWTTNYGDDMESRLEEFEDVIKAGYCNTISGTYLTDPRVWEICEKYNVTVWINLSNIFNSKKQTIEEYMARQEPTLNFIKSNPKWWNLFQGFHYEEKIWRGETNEDFLTETRAFYQKYGKRNFAVLATGEFTGVEGNEQQIGTSGENMKKMLPMAFEYLTDVSFDSYSVDVRDGATNGDVIRKSAMELPGIVDGKTYYSELTKLLLRITGHPANVWYFPCAYTTSLWGGLDGLGRANEDYCVAHLEYLYDLLMRQDYKGGLFLYTYMQWSNEKELGLRSHLIVEAPLSSEQAYKLRPHETKWKKYSKLVKDITTEFKTTTGDILYNVG